MFFFFSRKRRHTRYWGGRGLDVVLSHPRPRRPPPPPPPPRRSPPLLPPPAGPRRAAAQPARRRPHAGLRRGDPRAAGRAGRRPRRLRATAGHGGPTAGTGRRPVTDGARHYMP